MILDHLDNAGTYFGITDRLDTALRYLQETDLARMPEGQYELDGTRLFARVVEYDTRYQHTTFWEVHQQYIDVQYVLEGVELMGYAPLKRMSVGPYDDALDYCRCEGDGEFFRVESGYFVIFHPQDVHMPGLVVTEPAHVRKIVLKAAVDASR